MPCAQADTIAPNAYAEPQVAKRTDFLPNALTPPLPCLKWRVALLRGNAKEPYSELFKFRMRHTQLGLGLVARTGVTVGGPCGGPGGAGGAPTPVGSITTAASTGSANAKQLSISAVPSLAKSCAIRMAAALLPTAICVAALPNPIPIADGGTPAFIAVARTIEAMSPAVAGP